MRSERFAAGSRPVTATALLLFLWFLVPEAPAGPPAGKTAQETGPQRLNRMVELMEARLPALGIFSSNLSTRTGAALSGSVLDFVIIDLEHSPYDTGRLESYLLAMIHKREILEKGSLQPGVTPLVRVPSSGRERLEFVIKQVLDLGAFGLVVPHVDSAADALAAVRASRFGQLRGVPDYEPRGLRGVGYGWAARYWGLSGTEYARRADLWPLDPAGELILWVMIETAEAVENRLEIARTPGVSGLLIGPSDLAFSLGVPLGSPEVEAAQAAVLETCLETGVPCGTVTSADHVEERLRDGFRFLAVGGDGGLSTGVQEALRVGTAFRRRLEEER